MENIANRMAIELEEDERLRDQKRINALAQRINPEVTLEEQKLGIRQDKYLGAQAAKAQWEEETSGGSGILGLLRAGLNKTRKKGRMAELTDQYTGLARDKTAQKQNTALRQSRIAADKEQRGQAFDVSTALTEEQGRVSRQDASFMNAKNAAKEVQKNKMDAYGEIQEGFTDTGTPILFMQRGDGTLVDANTKEKLPLGTSMSLRYPEEAMKATGARQKMGGMLSKMADLYQGLFTQGAAISTSQSGAENILNYARSNLAPLEQAAGTDAGDIRNQIDSLRPLIINEIRQASEMGVRGMDTPAELNFYLQAMGDTTRNVESNMAAAIILNQTYGTGEPLANAEKYAKVLAELKAEYEAEKAGGGRGAPPVDKYNGFSIEAAN